MKVPTSLMSRSMSWHDRNLIKYVPTWWVKSRNIPPRQETEVFVACRIIEFELYCIYYDTYLLFLTLVLSHSLVLMNFIKLIYTIQPYELSFDWHVSCQPQYLIFEVSAYKWSRWMLLTSYSIQGVNCIVVIIVKYIHMNTTTYFSLYLQFLSIADIR